MIQLDILSGKRADGQLVVRHFPFRIGRAAGNELQLEDDGVWDRHLTLEFQKQRGFKLTTAANALVTINGEPVREKILRNGDTMTVGSAKLQFWLAAAHQRGLRVREFFVWTLLLSVTVGQFILIYWLLR
jgi:pSer/pThr/pTyr-binding forkhead associated (FHA) protein